MPDAGEDWMPIVPYVAFRCPRCGRHKPFTNGVRGRTRYHRCLHCGQPFKSWEMPAAAVRGRDRKPAVATSR